MKPLTKQQMFLPIVFQSTLTKLNTLDSLSMSRVCFYLKKIKLIIILLRAFTSSELLWKMMLTSMSFSMLSMELPMKLPKRFTLSSRLPSLLCCNQINMSLSLLKVTKLTFAYSSRPKLPPIFRPLKIQFIQFKMNLKLIKVLNFLSDLLPLPRISQKKVLNPFSCNSSTVFPLISN